MKLRGLLLNSFLSLGLLFGIQTTVLANSTDLVNEIPISQDQSELVKITGTITDENNEALPGVSVIVEGTITGTSTDFDGRFEIDVEVGAKLSISFIGYKTQTYNVTGATDISISLQPDAAVLDDVVVIGYGTQKKADLTSAISVIETKDIENVATSNIADAIQGSAPGVSVKSTGSPDGAASIEIRGVGTFGDSNPLYIIDGMPTDGGRDFNVNDIESIQILKDAAAASIYGSKAANGVIIITTKKGKAGELKIEYSGNTSVQWLPRIDLANREEYIYLNDMLHKNSGVALQGHFNGTRFEGTNTDWQDVFTKPGIINDHNLTFSGGNKDGVYLVSLNYFNNSGTVYGNDFTRYSLRINSSLKKGIFEIGENIQLSLSQANGQAGWNSSMFWNMQRLVPTIPVKNSDNPGGWGYGDPYHANTGGNNIRGIMDLENNHNENDRIRGNIYTQLNFTDWLNVRSSGAYEMSRDRWALKRKPGNWHMDQGYWPSMYSQSRGTYNKLTWTNTLNINKELGDHSFNFVAGSEYYRVHYDSQWSEVKDLNKVGEDDYFWVLAGTQDMRTGSSIGASAMISYFTRLNYNYDNRYFLGATVRRDGNSQLPEANRWGTFPSVSVGWKISNESFMEDIEWLSILKLRASYGELGNVNIGDWDYVPTLSTNPEAIMTSNPDERSFGISQTNITNDNLIWETSIQRNIGIDAAFLQNKLTLTADYYYSESENVLVGVPLLMTSGDEGAPPISNAASLLNSGVELNVGWKETKGDFAYSVNLNLSKMQNEVTSLGAGNSQIDGFLSRTIEGQPLAMLYLIQSNGIFQSEAEVDEYLTNDGNAITIDGKRPQPGDIRFIDYDGSGNIDENDRQFLGNPWPDLQMGIMFSASYKDFDFSLSGNGQFGNDVLNGNKWQMEKINDDSNYAKGLTPWTPENPNNHTPRAVLGDTPNGSWGHIDRWMEDGSFFRVKTMTAGYTLPKEMTNKLKLDKLRFSITGQNLITLTNYSGLDPDFMGQSFWARGMEPGAFAAPFTITGGVQLAF
ncbi:MAG: TonB-dependent receptor [Bacteroidota bacterium]